MNNPVTVIVTRPPGQSQEFLTLLKEAGIHSLHLPVFELRAVPLTDETREVIEQAGSGAFPWIAFTSASAVSFFSRAIASCRAGELPENIRIAAIGHKTAAQIASDLQRPASCVAERSYGADMGAELAVRIGTPVRLLLPGVRDGRRELSEALTARGIEAVDLPIYERHELRLAAGQVESLKQIPVERRILTFFSPSAVSGIVREFSRCGEPLSGLHAIAVGNTTAQAMRDCGIEPGVLPEDTSAESVVSAVREVISRLRIR